MAATLLSTIITNARVTLLETSAKFWTDAELLVYGVDACKDLWRAVIDLEQGHFQTVDETNVSLTVGANTLSGVPTDVFRVDLIEPVNLTSSGTVPDLNFEPRPLNHPDFSGARSLGSVSPTGQTIYFALQGAGAPTSAPSIYVAPALNSALAAGSIRLIYTPALPALTAASGNPIPGESDHAIYCWIMAHARAKETDGRTPDATWMAMYANDKRELLTGLTPRQTVEPDYADACFEAFWM